MTTTLSYFALIGPILLLACIALPSRRTALCRNIGTALPWLVFGGALLAVIGMLVSGNPLSLKVSFSDSGPLSDLTFIWLDKLSGTILLLVSFLGAIISRFARNYIAGEAQEGSFYKWLCVTVGSVICVILSGNLLLFTLAWMATSLSLHHLLLFYPERPAAQLAAKKKFMISRIGDLCLISAVVWVGVTFGTLDFPSLFTMAEAVRAGSIELPAFNLNAIGLLLALGALMKSAQFPFHTWLPDTLETPTPVSALMHAGVINAGGYLIIRLSPLVVLSTPSLSLLALIGAVTAVFAGLVMLTQTSIKKSLAFSTIAQMGFMMLQCGLGAFSLAVLHIVAHSLYKAHAFLNSGTLAAERKPIKLPTAGTVVAAIAFGAVAFVGINALLGGMNMGSAYSWLLGLVVVLGLAHFVQHSLSALAHHKLKPAVSGVLTVVGLSAVYGLLHSGSGAFLGDSVAAAPTQASTAQLVLFILIAALFIASYILPLLARRYPNNATLRQLYSHASHGFYCNTWINRIVQKQPATALHQPGFKPHAITDPSGEMSAVDRACARIAPLWPLQHFVAVNPYLGYAGQDFNASAHHLNRVTEAKLVPELSEFSHHLASESTLCDAHINAAIKDAGSEIHKALKVSGIALNAESVRAAALDPEGPRAAACEISTFVAFIDVQSDGYWERLVTEDLSRRCAAQFDQTQAAWPSPFKSKPLFCAWKDSMQADHNMDLAGVPGFRAAVATLPDQPRAVIQWALHTLRVPAALAVDFLQAELFSLRGWVGYCQYLRHDARLTGGDDDSIVDLLAIRLAYDAFLFQTKAGKRMTAKWDAMLEFASEGSNHHAIAPDLALRCILQDALERSRRETLFADLNQVHGDSKLPAKTRSKLQAIFCIDVRSEIYRRALEAQSREIETIGFAGFFGIALSYQMDETDPATARCPVLLSPSVAINGGCHPLDSVQQAKAWKAFEKDAPACFPFVETMGLSFTWKTLQSSFPSATPRSGIDASPAPISSLDSHARTRIALGILTNLGLTKDFAHYVLFAGHGSHTTNNPHASGLDCGACGGHAGDVNARIAADLLNDRSVRTALADSHAIEIPDDTRFLAGLHNTTTDEMKLFAAAGANELSELTHWLDAAAVQARVDRAPLLGLANDSKLHDAIRRRANDWSQTRPEWGLAGNYAFIAAPRARTRSLNLGGRVFLHNYDAAQDPEGKVLTLILTAPVVVASWINLQYYGSTVDNARFGSGTKVIHNIAAGIGVLSGNGGDLQTGFPLQSLAAADAPVHEALRLHVCVQASTEAIDAVLAAQSSIRQLVENRWLHLFALPQGPGDILQRKPGGKWQVAAPHAQAAVA
jgi:uncharacterized protein YbcC (UPF0753/DUF2309 family)/NADH:ubiquinone oxidoreductase subunit 5 (subunit L)/multisubunit Na+/H+ antiporter MnhA subunit